jgi:hypothetical protein
VPFPGCPDKNRTCARGLGNRFGCAKAAHYQRTEEGHLAEVTFLDEQGMIVYLGNTGCFDQAS